MRDCSVQGGYITLGPPPNENDPNAVYPAGCALFLNNLFQYVQVELYPSFTSNTTPQNTSGPNVNMPVCACNNLFRQGSLGLEPTTNSNGSNWVFTDNLFDQEAFLQDARQPLDYAYDAYWPLAPLNLPVNGTMFLPVLPWYITGTALAGLSPTTTGDGTTDGTGNQTNTAPPVYETGFFGSYYQAANSPLLNTGSRTAKAASLAAFTVLTNGIEESNSTVSIGLHYVATNGSGVPYSGTNGLADWWQWEYYGSNTVSPNAVDTNGDGYTALEKYQLGLDPSVFYGNPLIVQPPLNQQAYVGAAAGFTVLAGGTLPLSYQWAFNGNPVPGATTSSLAFSSAQLTNAGDYWVIVTSVNSNGVTNEVTSAPATLSVLSDFMLTIQPSCAVDPGRSAMFTVSSVVSIGTSYQWYFGGSAIPGATASSYTLTNAQPTNAGYYSVSVNSANRTNLMAYFGVLEGPPPPVANADIFTVPEGYWDNQLDVLANDYVMVGSLVITNITQPQHGTTSIASDGQSIYYSATNSAYVGSDSFTYTVADGIGARSTNTVTVFISSGGTNTLNALDVNVILQTNVFTTAINLATNGGNTGDTISVYSPGTPSLGTVSVTNAVITYTRYTNLFGPDTFTFTITDSNAGWAQATITVDQTNASGDGIPDQWKLLYGLSLANDVSTNDPDGDGLPNLAEYLLHTDPLVPDNPLNISTNLFPGTLSGTVLVPLSVNAGVSNNVALELFVDGGPADACIQMFNGAYVAQWDTLSVTNGVHSISIRMTCPLTSGLNFTVFGDSACVIVMNAINVSPLSRRFTDSLIIDANLSTPETTYRVEVYDRATQQHLTTLSGAIVNGAIEDEWDFQGSGINVSGPLSCDFYVGASEAGFGGSATHANPGLQLPTGTVIYKWFNVLDDISYTIAWGFDEFSSTQQGVMNLQMGENVVSVLDTVAGIFADEGGRNDYNLLPSGFNVPYTQTAFQWTGGYSLSQINLVNALKDSTSANFFWHGHGLVNEITPTRSSPRTTVLWSSTVAGDLLNSDRWGLSRHPYRLVILDACLSFSPEWADAFGIPRFSISQTQWAKYGVDAQAFVGWTVNLPLYKSLYNGSSGTDALTEWGTAEGILQTYWMLGYPLNYCVGVFAETLNSWGPPYSTGSTIYDSVTAGYWPPNAYSYFQIYGAYDLTSLDQY
jgi:hypothetical protein